jgi:low affinity Fe/Cu permease
MRNVVIRIAVWAGVGSLVALWWGFYFANADKSIPIDPTMHALARLTQPATAVALYLNPIFSLSLGWAVLANVATYALLASMAVAIQKCARAIYWQE